MDRSQSRIRAWQVSTRLRSIAVSGGLAVFGYFLLRPGQPAISMDGWGMLGIAVAIQVGVLATTALLKRCMDDAELAAQSSYIVELLADALTVLFVVIGTIRALGA